MTTGPAGPAVSVAFLSNQALAPAINWSLLGDPVVRALETRGADVIRPAGNALGTVIGEKAALPRRVRRSDAVLWMQLSSRPEWPLAALALSAHGRSRGAYVIDPWPYVLRKVDTVVQLLGVDPCFVSFRQAYDALSVSLPDGPYVHLPFGFDAEVFRPRETSRDIFALWMGRRHEALHAAISRYCETRGLNYVAPRGGSIRDPDELGALAARARYFVVTPPDIDHPERAGGFSPLVMRYLEGLGAGCRLLGVLPGSGEFEDLLPVDSILQVAPDGTDLAARLDADRDGPWSAVDEATEAVHTHHTWVRRADQMVEKLQAHTSGRGIGRRLQALRRW